MVQPVANRFADVCEVRGGIVEAVARSMGVYVKYPAVFEEDFCFEKCATASSHFVTFLPIQE